MESVDEKVSAFFLFVWKTRKKVSASSATIRSPDGKEQVIPQKKKNKRWKPPRFEHVAEVQNKCFRPSATQPASNRKEKKIGLHRLSGKRT